MDNNQKLNSCRDCPEIEIGGVKKRTGKSKGGGRGEEKRVRGEDIKGRRSLFAGLSVTWCKHQTATAVVPGP